MSNTFSISPQLLHLDVAVISQEYSTMNLKNLTDHVVELDPVDISEFDFKNIFFNNSDNFSIISATLLSTLSAVLQRKISFKTQTVNQDVFLLLDTIYNNIEKDLNISRVMLTPCSTIALNREIVAINTLCDLVLQNNIKCSLTWSEIQNVVATEFAGANSASSPYPVILTISVVFVSQCLSSGVSSGIYPTIIKFNYKTTVTIP